MKQVRVKADDSQTITAIYEFLHDLDNEYSNFSNGTIVQSFPDWQVKIG